MGAKLTGHLQIHASTFMYMYDLLQAATNSVAEKLTIVF